MTDGPMSAAEEAALLAAFHAEIGEVRPVHSLGAWSAGADCYVTGDSIAAHESNVTCEACAVHLLTPDLLPLCDVAALEQGATPDDLAPGPVTMTPVAADVTCKTCLEWMHA